MSRTVDQRVVEMQFDNRQFEQNVSTTLSTLDKLKQSLNLTGAVKGFENIGSAARGINLQPLSNATDVVVAKFSHMQMSIQHQLDKIVDSAFAAGKRIISALTIDPIKTGFSEYETQINSVQTILANTESKGTTLDDVNNALDTLNTYADKTIYNFTEMTRNIGTFTAAGVDLDTATNAIQGIANLAAVSGSNAQQASTAMYQLSQALSSGTVKLQDWNSVVNAGMGGQVFQDALKETARVHGVKIDEMIKKQGSFRETLSKGWLTSEILTETLQKFTLATEGLTEAEIQKNREMLKSKGYTDEQIESIFKLGNTATNAATKVKTLTQLWDTLKEAAQSGWTQSWETIVGDFGEAKELFTEVSDTIGKLIGDSAEARNKLLSGALDSNWKKMTKAMGEVGVSTTDLEKKLRTIAEADGIELDTLIKEYGSLENVFKKGALSSDLLNKALDELGGSTADLTKINRELKKSDIGDDVKELQQALLDAGYDLGKAGVDGNFGKYTEAAVKAFQEVNGLEVTGVVDEKTLAQLEKTNSTLDSLSEKCSEFTSKITELGGRENLIQALRNAFEAVMSVIKPIKEAFREIFPPITVEQLYSLTEKIRDFTKGLILTEEQSEKVKTTFKGLFSLVDIGWTFVKQLAAGVGDLLGNFTGLGGSILDTCAAFGEWLIGLKDTVKETDIFGAAINKVVGFIGNAIDKIKEFGGSVKEYIDSNRFEGFLGFFKGFQNVIKQIATKIGDIFSPLVNGIKNVFTDSTFYDIIDSGLLAGILAAVVNFSNKLTGPLQGITDIFESVAGEGGVLSSVKDILDGVKGSLEAYQNSLKADILQKIAIAIGILAASIFVISSIPADALDHSLGAIGVMFAELMGSLYAFTKLSPKLGGVTKAVGLMIGMSIAVGILAGAMKKVASLDWEGIAKGLVGVGALMAELFLFMQYAKFDTKMTGTALGIILLSTAMVIMAKAVKSFSTMKWEEIGKGLAAIGALLLEVGLFTKLTGNAKNVISTGLAMVLLGASMKIFASAMKDFASMSWEEIGRGLAAMGGALAELVIALNLTKGSFGGAVSLLVASAALAVLAPVMKSLGEMQWDEIGRGLAVMGGALAELAIALLVMNGTLAGSAALIIAAAALAMIAPVMKSLGELSWEQIGKGLVTLAGAFAVIGVAGLLLTPLIPTLLGLAGAFALFGVATLAIGAGLTMIGAGISAIATSLAVGATAIVAGLAAIIGGIVEMIPTVILGLGDAILAICTIIKECAPAIVETIFVLLAEVCTTLATYVPMIGNALFDLLIGALNVLTERMPELIAAALDVIGAFFTGIADALMGMDTSALLKGVIGFAIVTALAYALSGIAAIIPGAMLGVIGVGALIAEIALVIAAIGALAQIPGLNWLIEQGGNFLQSIGTAIGQFIGGIVGGIAEGATSTLPQVGTNLTDFMNNLQGFLSGVQGIDSSILENVQALAGAILALTGAGLLDAVTSWLTGGSSLSQFAQDLVPFGAAMKDYAAEVNGIDSTSISSSVTAAKGLISIANSIPSDGLFGTDGIDDFGRNLVSFAKSMKKYGEQVVGLEVASITASVAAAKGLVQVARLIPDDGTFGGDGIDNFGKDIVKFAKSLKDYSDKVASVSSSGIKASASAVRTLISAINSMAGMNSSGISTFKKAINDLSKVNIDGVVKTFEGASSKLSGIGSKMVDSIAKGLKSKSTALTTTANSLVTVLNTALSKEVSEFGKAGVKFATELASGISKQRTKVKSAITTIVNTAVSSARGYYSNFYSAGSYLVTGFANGISANSYRAAAKAKAMAQAAARAARNALDINSPSRVGYEIGDFFGMGFVNAIGDYTKTAYNASAEMAGSAKKGLQNSISNISAAFGDDGLSPVIRPVLDLSNVQAGAGTIGSLFGTESVGLSAVGSISTMMNRRGQNGGTSEVVSAIDKLRKELGNVGNTSYNINGVTYDRGTELDDAFRTIVRYARIEGRV